MQVFDDKTTNAVNINSRLILNSPIKADDTAFKATYYATADLVCSGKITALFDLFVIGNVVAKEIDVKGKFVCLGKCEVSDTLLVQNDIICSEIEADTIICHENITAQELESKQITCNGRIIIEKTLAVEEIAKCDQTVICGETAYGSGRIVANTVITGEPVDLDDGEKSIVSPYVYSREDDTEDAKDKIVSLSQKYRGDNNYRAFLDSIKQNGNEIQQSLAERYLCAFNQIEKVNTDGIEDFRDTKLLLQLLDMMASGWFEGWQTVEDYKYKLLHHFEALASGDNPYIPKPKPATDLQIGDFVRHTIYGDGYVKNRTVSSPGAMIEIEFDGIGIKKFSIPAALKFFKILGSKKSLTPEATRASLVCNVDNYREWIECLKVLFDNASLISPSLHGCIYDLLMANLGLKSKFVLERFQEKGWKINGK